MWPFKTSCQVGTPAQRDEAKAKAFPQKKKAFKHCLVNLAGAVCLKELLKDGTLPLCQLMGEQDESPLVSPQPP